MLTDVEILQVDAGAPPVGLRTVDFAGQMARQLGATVFTSAAFEREGTFLGRGKSLRNDTEQDPVEWCNAAANRFLLVAGSAWQPESYATTSAVLLKIDPLATEGTLMAGSAMAELLGDPDEPPLIPTGDWGAGTAAYGVLAAICALVTRQQRFGVRDIALVDAVGVLAWVNWKAAVTAELGGETRRQGEAAEWPVVPCADGHFALVYQERDWQPLTRMIGDERLLEDRFGSFRQRAKHRDEYMALIREWAAGMTKAELVDRFLEYEIPAAPVMTERDLLADPLLCHRGTFAEAESADGKPCKTPCLAHRVIETTEAPAEPARNVDSTLPLAGLRVLDLGIITAGAGVGGLLADLGAEVLKIESHSYPDPFRQWAGEAVSPLFKCNNRNKYGLALDLKTEEGRAEFRSLVRSADLVLENFRRGVLDRLGFDYATLRDINPGIVLASISGQGLDGPGSGATSFGSTLEASSGFSMNAMDGNGLPYITGRNLNYPDQTVVLYAAAVLTAALADRSRGLHIDIAQRDVAVFLGGETIELLTQAGEVRRQDNGRSYAAADGRHVATTVIQAPDGQPVADWIAGRSAGDAAQALRDAGISAARVAHGDDILRQFEAGHEFDRSPNGDLVKGFPFQFCGEPMAIHLDSPDVGQHNDKFIGR